MVVIVFRCLLFMRVLVSLAIGERSLETRRKCAIILSMLIEKLVDVAARQLAASLRAEGLIGDEGGFTTMDSFGFEYDLESTLSA